VIRREFVSACARLVLGDGRARSIILGPCSCSPSLLAASGVKAHRVVGWDDDDVRAAPSGTPGS